MTADEWGSHHADVGREHLAAATVDSSPEEEPLPAREFWRYGPEPCDKPQGAVALPKARARKKAKCGAERRRRQLEQIARGERAVLAPSRRRYEDDWDAPNALAEELLRSKAAEALACTTLADEDGSSEEPLDASGSGWPSETYMLRSSLSDYANTPFHSHSWLSDGGGDSLDSVDGATVSVLSRSANSRRSRRVNMVSGRSQKLANPSPGDDTFVDPSPSEHSHSSQCLGRPQSFRTSDQMGTHSNRANMDEKTYRKLGVAPKTLPRRLTRQLYRDFGVSLDFVEGSCGNLVSVIRFDQSVARWFGPPRGSEECVTARNFVEPAGNRLA